MSWTRTKPTTTPTRTVGTVANPFNPPRPVTTPFRKPGSWAAGYHTGVDYGAPQGTPVHAIADGTVVEVGTTSWGAAYGDRSVIVAQAGGIRTLYAHLEGNSVRRGQKITAGQRIGIVGNRGRSFGPHLHLECRKAPYGYGSPHCVDPNAHGAAGQPKPPVPKYPGRAVIEKAQKANGKAPGIKAFKAALRRRGIAAQVRADDTYGGGLTEAVKAAQKKLGLPVTGIAGIHIWHWAFTGQLTDAAKKRIEEEKKAQAGKPGKGRKP